MPHIRLPWLQLRAALNVLGIWNETEYMVAISCNSFRWHGNKVTLPGQRGVKTEMDSVTIATHLGITPRSMKVDFLVLFPMTKFLIFLMEVSLVGWPCENRPSTRAWVLSWGRRGGGGRGGGGRERGEDKVAVCRMA